MLKGEKILVRRFGGVQELEFRGPADSSENCVVALNGEEHIVSWCDLREKNYVPPEGKPRAVDELWYPSVTDRLARLLPAYPELRGKFLADLFLTEEDFQKLKKLTHAAAKAYGHAKLDEFYDALLDLTAEIIAAWTESGRITHKKLREIPSFTREEIAAVLDPLLKNPPY